VDAVDAVDVAGKDIQDNTQKLQDYGG